MRRTKVVWSIIVVVVCCVPFLSVLAQEITIIANANTTSEVEIKLGTRFITSKGKETEPYLYSGEPGALALT